VRKDGGGEGGQEIRELPKRRESANCQIFALNFLFSTKKARQIQLDDGINVTALCVDLQVDTGILYI
jgi:hypothetical protein